MHQASHEPELLGLGRWHVPVTLAHAFLKVGQVQGRVEGKRGFSWW